MVLMAPIYNEAVHCLSKRCPNNTAEAGCCYEDCRLPWHVGAPTVHEDIYGNRTRNHSINVHVVFDTNYAVLDPVPKWPVSTHDVHILSESGFSALFEQ